MDAPRQRVPSFRLCLCASILFFAYGCLLAAKSIAGFPTSHNTHTRWPWLSDKPVGEDGFYMLTVAQNIATTHHLVYTFSMPATGVQPLATVIFASIAFVTNHLGGDQWTLIRAILLFGTTLFIVFAWQLAFIAADIAPPHLKSLVFPIAFFLTLCDFSAFRLFTYGLETGIYLVYIALCLTQWLRITHHTRATWPDILLFGLTAGVAGLARIDFGLIFIFLLAYLLLKRIATPLQTLTTGATALAVTLPWFLFIHSASGHWLPSSGKAESRLITLHDIQRLPPALAALVAHLCPWSYADARTPITNVIAALSLLLLLTLLWRTRKSLGAFSAFRDRGLLAAWLPAFALLFLTYVTLFWSWQFYVRYISPLLLVTIPLIAILLATQTIVQRRPKTLFAALALFFCLYDISSLHRGHIVLDHSIRAGYIHSNFPTTHVASFQTGTSGYFNPNVENLDGKLNQRALIAASNHQMEAFIDAEHINVLIDWPGFLGQLSPTYLAREWQPCPQPLLVPDSICLVRKSTAAPE